MYLNPEIARMYRSGVSPRIAAALSGIALRNVIRQYSALSIRADQIDKEALLGLRKVAAAQIGMQVQELCVSGTNNALTADSQCKMAIEYFDELARLKAGRIGCVTTVCTLPVVLDLITRDSLGSAAF